MGDMSRPAGTWYIKVWLKDRPTAPLASFSIVIVHDAEIDTFTGVFRDEQTGTSTALTHISWRPCSRQIIFCRDTGNAWEWFQGTIVEGVITGRFTCATRSSASPPPEHCFLHRFTGWNSDYLDRDIVPRVYDIVLGQRCKAILRLDRSSQGLLSGRFKVYATWNGTTWDAAGEEVEYDLHVQYWDGQVISFVRQGNGLQEKFTGIADGNGISGTYMSTNQKDLYSWYGERSQVLSYGIAEKSLCERKKWQERVSLQLMLMLMADNPTPSSSSIIRGKFNITPAELYTSIRDDACSCWPQQYRLHEFFLEHILPPAWKQRFPLFRQSHAWLAVPTEPPGSGKYPVAVVLHGHGSSAWEMFQGGENEQSSKYWYGDAFARRGYVVLGLDLAPQRDHPPCEDDRVNDLPLQDNPILPARHARLAHASDWEQSGMDVWDVMRALDLLLAGQLGVQVDASSIVIAGLDMGAEIALQTAALDPRITMLITAGLPADLHVKQYLDDYCRWCWRYANICEYVDVSDLFALVAPRPVVMETGLHDRTSSLHPAPFAASKQLARRCRVAYEDNGADFIHYLHDGGKEFRVGEVGDRRTSGIRVPAVIAPGLLEPQAGQTDSTTFMVEPSLFGCIQDLLYKQKKRPSLF